MKQIALSLLLLFWLHQVLSQSLPTDLIFEHYTIEHGLPGRNIRNAVQGEKDFMWVCTSDNGIARFDGLQFKPFNKVELEVRLRKLIELRGRMQSRYQTLSPPAEETVDPAEEREDAFLAKLRQLLEANLSDEEYGILQLCRELAVSLTQLHRNLKALTGKSTSQVIRSIRLQKAKELLRTTDQNVSEIGYQVGFSNPSHFSQVFSEEFGFPPSEGRK